MTMLSLVLSLAMASVPKPSSTVTHSLTVVQPDGIVGELRQISLTTRRFPRRDINVLTRWGRARREERQVLPPSLARAIASEISNWIIKIGAHPKGLDLIGCTRRVGAVHANRRVDLCLDALGDADRVKFLGWYTKTGEWVE